MGIDELEKTEFTTVKVLGRDWAMDVEVWSFWQKCKARIAEMEKEVSVQCRLNGMGAERELRLMAERDELKAKLEASEWIRRDSALRTYDGLTDDLAKARAEVSSLRSEVEQLRLALQKIESWESENGCIMSPKEAVRIAKAALDGGNNE